MHKHTFVALVFATALAGCASSRSDSGLGHTKVKIIEPEVTFTQTSVVAQVARDMTGNIPVRYQVRVANKSGEPITLTRIDVQSLGEGAYSLRPQSHPFKTVIGPDQFEVVDFWVPAFISEETGPTVYGANGPVTLRSIAHFDSPVGQFDHVTIQQVHDHPAEENKPH